MSNVTLTGSICLTVFFLFIVFVYLRLLNFSLFFHLCCSTTYVGEIKLYINLTTAPSGQRSCHVTGSMQHQQAAPWCNTIHPPQHANYTCGEKKPAAPSVRSFLQSRVNCLCELSSRCCETITNEAIISSSITGPEYDRVSARYDKIERNMC